MKPVKKYNILNILIIGIVPLVLCVIWFHSNNVLGSGESALPFYDFSHNVQNFSTAWNQDVVGSATSINIAAEPTYVALLYLNKIITSPALLQALFFGILLVSAGISIYHLTKQFFPGLNNTFYMVTVLFYWFNPISLVNVWNRFLYNYMVAFALLPLATLLYVKGIKNRNYIFSILIAITSLIFSYALSDIVFDILLWFIFTAFSIFIFFSEPGREIKVFVLKFFFITLISFILVNSWWIGQLFSFVDAGIYTSSVSNFFNNSGNLAGLSTLSKELGQLSNLFLFMHGTFYSSGPGWAMFYNFLPIKLAEFLITGLILWIIFKFRKTQEVLFLGVLFFVVLFLMKGNEPPFGELFQWAFLKSSILQVFRNPFEKFGFLLPLIGAPLFGFGLEHISTELHSEKKQRLLLLGTFSILIIIWGFPFWTGLVFTSNDGNTQKLRNYEVAVPKYYQDANNWLSHQGGNFRFVSLPIGGEGITYTWNKPYSGVELSSTLFSTPNISFNTTIPFYNDLVTNLSNHQLDPGVLDFLPFVAGKYIIWRDDIDYKTRDLPDPNITKKYLDTWVKQGFLIKSFSEGPLIIYQVKPNYFWPKIYTTSNIFLTNDQDLSDVSKFIPDFPDNRSAFISLANQPKTLNESSYVVSPEETLTPQIASASSTLTDQDLLARLPYVKHLPGEWIYPLIRLKDSFETPSKNNYSSWLLYENNILGKRAVEIFLLYQQSANKKTIAQAEGNYMDTLEQLKPDFINTVQDNDLISQVIKQSLYYEYTLLSRSRSPVVSSLDDILAGLELKPYFSLPPLSSGKYLVYRFQIPQAEQYLASGLSKSLVNKIFIDGNLITNDDVKKNAKESKFYLSVGIHEIAVEVTSQQDTNPILTGSNFWLSNNANKSWHLSVSDNPSVYQVSFNYRFLSGNTFNMQFSQKDDLSPSYGASIVKNSDNNGWKHWQSEFSTKMGFGDGNLTISPVKKEICNGVFIWKDCASRIQPYQVELTNFVVSKQVDTPSLILISQGRTLPNNSQGMNIQWQRVDSTHYKVKVSKSSTIPGLLVFSELFDPRWKILYSDGSSISSKEHFLANDFANAWILDKTGDYNLSIVFTPQYLLDIGDKLSITSTIACLVILGGYILWKRRK